MRAMTLPSPSTAAQTEPKPTATPRRVLQHGPSLIVSVTWLVAGSIRSTLVRAVVTQTAPAPVVRPRKSHFAGGHSERCAVMVAITVLKVCRDGGDHRVGCRVDP
jgi:hypothetical protein